MSNFRPTPLNPLNEITYFPATKLRTVLGVDSDDGDRMQRERRQPLRRGCSYTAKLILLAVTVIPGALAMVIVLGGFRESPGGGSIDRDPGVQGTGAGAGSVTGLVAGLVEGGAHAEVPVSLSGTQNNVGLIVSEDQVQTVTHASASSTLVDALSHALGTARIEIVPTLSDPTGPVVLRLHGELVPIDVRSSHETPFDQMAGAFVRGLLISDEMWATPPACAIAAPDSPLLGLYVRTSCASRPMDRIECIVRVEPSCLSQGRVRLAATRRYDAHNGPWVFSYSSTSNYT